MICSSVLGTPSERLGDLSGVLTWSVEHNNAQFRQLMGVGRPYEINAPSGAPIGIGRWGRESERSVVSEKKIQSRGHKRGARGRSKTI